MTVFLSTLNQMAFLMLLIVIGYLLTRLKAVPDNTTAAISKLENNVFIPALVLGTFMENFTVDKLSTSWQYLVGGFAVVLLMVPLAILLARLCSKDSYIRKIYTYGLAFPNFGFMGNAVVAALFPDYFMEYLIFTLPFWTLIYLYGVPTLLIPTQGDRHSLKDRLKPFLNPMFIAMLVGMVVGLLAPKLPSFLNTAVASLGNCMSPLAMLLTGMTIAKIDLRATLRSSSLYLVSLFRVLVIPMLLIPILKLLGLPYVLCLCIVCCQAMPLGLSTIVIPSAYGLDTSRAAGMALISHLMSCLTIPVVFLLFQLVIG